MTFGASPMPNHRISQRRQRVFRDALRGHDERLDRRRSRAATAAAGTAAPTPQTQPMTKPIADTRKVATMSVKSLPFAAISTMRCAVASGGAKNSGPKARAPHSQAASSATAKQDAAAGDDPLPRDRRGFPARSSAMSALLIARPPGCARRSPRSPACVKMSFDVARPRDRDRMLGGDARRPPRQHQRAVAERDRLGDVVGDEDDGLALEAPQPQQVLLQLRAGLRVDRARTARPSGSSAGRRPACGSAPRACACRRTVRADNSARSRRARPRRSAPARAARAASSSAPCTSSGNSTLSMVVRHGSRLSSCVT